MSVLEVLMSGVKKEAQNVKDFVTTPKGIFETVDRIVIDARSTVRQAAGAVGIRPVLGQKLRGLSLQRLRPRRRRF